MAERRLVFLEERSFTPSFIEFNPLPTLRETQIAINYAKAIMQHYQNYHKHLLIIDNKTTECRVYKIKTGEGEVIYAISDSVLAEIDKDGKILRYTPSTFFVRR
ncbi:MAG TPA: hypothetical protein VLE44_02235 [Candidatus Saccharimonadales bacterium]|nr:hypothetical protein [Candidatus Saccharimonadales bacterium]